MFGIITTEAPLQITLLLPNGFILIVGVGFTVIVAKPASVAAFEHPVVLLLPSIVYVVLEVGLIVKLVPVWLPGFNVYVFAPTGIITSGEPLQITPLFPNVFILIIGVGFTVIGANPASAVSLEHPVALLVPSIVYVVLLLGLIVKLVPVWLPGFNVYEVAPLGIITTVVPLQITLLLPNGFILIVGVGFTIIGTKAASVTVFEHPVVLFVPSIV